MTLRELEYIAAVAEHGSFSRAAEAVHVSQPTLSAQVRKLETTLGVDIFERASRGVLPTEAGRAILESAQRILREAEHLRDTARAVRDPRGVLAEFGVTHGPDVRVDVWDSTAELRYMVLPQRPAGTEGLDEAALAALVTRNAMIGTDDLKRKT